MRPHLEAARTACVAVALALALPASAHADTARDYDVSFARDGLIAGAGTLLWIGSESAKPVLAPETCRTCDPNALDDTLARATRWSELALPAKISDGGLVVLPLLSMGALAGLAWHDEAAAQLPADLLLVAESVAVAQVLNQATKFSVGRERPFVHWLSPAEKSATAQPSDNNLSFFSGHTTFSFAVVTASWSVARHRGYRGAAWILGLGGPLAAAIGYLRMAAGKHYFSDVLVGVGVGAACGVVVPMLHETGTSATSGVAVSIVPTSGGLLASAGLAW